LPRCVDNDAGKVKVKNKKVEAKKKKAKTAKAQIRPEAAQYVDNLLELQKVQAAVLNQLNCSSHYLI